MANKGPNTNNSQLLITTVPCPLLNGKNVVFGEVIEGVRTIKTLECQGFSNGEVKVELKIEDCGQL